MDDEVGKCNLCHRNAGANASLAGVDLGNASFNTGVEDLPDQPAQLTGENVPRDDGFGTPGDSTFNVPPLVEAADTGPFFHNNSVETIEAAVGFYDGDAFNQSPAGRFLASIDPEGASIELDATQIVAVAAFLRVINALENIRQSNESLERSAKLGFFALAEAVDLLSQAGHETDDAIQVLSGAGLHPEAVMELQKSKGLIERASRSLINRRGHTRAALAAQARARSLLLKEGS